MSLEHEMSESESENDQSCMEIEESKEEYTENDLITDMMIERPQSEIRDHISKRKQLKLTDFFRHQRQRKMKEANRKKKENKDVASLVS